MPKRRDSDRLSCGDALFLDLEREGMPLNVAGVSVFAQKQNELPAAAGV